MNGERSTGMIANSVIRASISPRTPRLAFYCLKRNFSHRLITESGKFCLHLLHRNQFDIIRRFGFECGETKDKFNNLKTRTSSEGCIILEECFAYFECTVLNSMDAGASTFFLGEVTRLEQSKNCENFELMSSGYFRDNMPRDIRERYLENKEDMVKWIEAHNEVVST